MACPFYQHVADAILSKSICQDGEHDFSAFYVKWTRTAGPLEPISLFYQVVSGTVVWWFSRLACRDVHEVRHRHFDEHSPWYRWRRVSKLATRCIWHRAWWMD